MQANLGGIMFWSLEADDFANKCNKGEYSLLKAAKAAMSNPIPIGIPNTTNTSYIGSLWKKIPLISKLESAQMILESGEMGADSQLKIDLLKQIEKNILDKPRDGYEKAAVQCAFDNLEKCKAASHVANQPIFVIPSERGDIFTTVEKWADQNHISNSADLISKLSNAIKNSPIESSPAASLNKKSSETIESRSSATRPLCRRRRSNRWKRACNVNKEIMLNNPEKFDPKPNLRITPINDGSPIQFVQRNPNAKNRVEYMKSLIQRHHLRTGSKPEDQPMRDYVNNLNGGSETVDAGHILSNLLGGPETKSYNMFPQLPNYNRNVWTGVEKEIANRVEKNYDIEFTLKLMYENNETTKPYEIRFQAKHKNEIVSEGDLLNPDRNIELKIPRYNYKDIPGYFSSNVIDFFKELNKHNYNNEKTQGDKNQEEKVKR